MALRKLYNWVLHWARTPYSVPVLFGLAFIESSVFPIPPDVLLIAMVLTHPPRAFYYATICSVGSVVGGLFGYAIGHFLWQTLHGFFIPHIFSQHIFDVVSQKYEVYSFWVVFTAALTPIPYKIFTIAAGVCGINLAGFLIASIIGRSMRFFLVAAILYFWGEKTKNFISRYLEWLTLAFAALLILGFFWIKRMV